MKRKKTKEEKEIEEIAKIIDPNNTFLKECDNVVKWKKKTDKNIQERIGIAVDVLRDSVIYYPYKKNAFRKIDVDLLIKVVKQETLASVKKIIKEFGNFDFIDRRRLLNKLGEMGK